MLGVLLTHTVHLGGLECGLRTEYLEVIVTIKPKESVPLSEDEHH